ncbi:thiamine diphosphokinase [Lacticaseibacillus chiayiensis]|uniref:Thiamine diphosphokinase n=1 Tax=Lacticaseibacillus chiayiensis TaxID=2100821 RepID=A0A4Q1UC53_9LACO|nr:thiamine diphosphokinase [Lacticaseibacillus chiayiensis]QVI33601.1 thiamine diphosphokinase [Lacticaseibacillus chiayiensis]RXT29536.1 thiamine diphosphokinase [Lacticaseibacillus chiayiensis]RXT59245.1 thiamine diphosphokinase [Lacticaseibacillus chiayiensis]UYN55344.1 thiamine diphosphokinase [Lacticaseibacillus chiayiensis]
MTDVNIMAGGPQDNLSGDWQQLTGKWIGVDRGALRLVKAGIQPVLAVGDFDSLTSEEFQLVHDRVQEIEQVPSAKDDTDTELAMKVALTDFSADKVTLVGATGGRLDHLLSNLFLPLQPRFLVDIERIHLLDEQNHVDYYGPGTHEIQPLSGYRYVAVINLTPVTDLAIIGAKYPLKSWSAAYPYAWASNEFIGNNSFTVRWTTGQVAIIYSRDRVGQKADN